MNPVINIQLPQDLHTRLLRVMTILHADEAPADVTDISQIVIRELHSFVDGWESTYGITGWIGALSDDQIAMATGFESLESEAEVAL